MSLRRAAVGGERREVGDEVVDVGWLQRRDRRHPGALRDGLRDDIIQPFPYPQAAYFPKKIRQSKDIRIQKAPFKLASGETLELRVFLDRSILEVFANGRQCVTQRIYPFRKDSRGVKLFSTGGAVTVKSLHAWDMARANAW